MLTRAIEILTGPLLIAQFGVIMISLFWSFLVVDVPTAAILDAVANGTIDYRALIAK